MTDPVQSCSSATEIALRMLQASSCFRPGAACGSLPCACAQALVDALSPTPQIAGGVREALRAPLMAASDAKFSNEFVGNVFRSHLEDIRDALSTQAQAGETRPFYGAECPSYPACDGGCGLGCTKEIERSRHSAKAAPDYRQALENARQEIVLAIAFLGRDIATKRLDITATQLCARLANADAAIRATLAVSSTDRCAECGHPRAEHSYNGACYGLCGKFVSSVPSTDRGVG